MASTKRRSSGLFLRAGTWHIDKVIFGRRICESTKSGELAEAEALLAHRVTQARRSHLYGEQRERSFREAARKFLAENRHKRSSERDVRALAVLDPFIGSLPIQCVHQDTLKPYVQARYAKRSSPGTINRELAVVRRILNLAARMWRDEAGRPWLASAPFIMRHVNLNQREPYPLSLAEQRLLFSELDSHLATMAAFKVNTGLREQEVVNLRWEWEVEVPELGISLFVIPRSFVKNGLDRFVVLNRTARSVVENCRGGHPEFVFTRNGKPLTKIYNSGWKGARRRAAERYEHEFGRPCPAGFQSIRVHDLKHSYGHRLRVAGVNYEARRILLGHKAEKNVTIHYSGMDIFALVEASERVCELETRAGPALSLVRVSSKQPTFEAWLQKGHEITQFPA
jgi:integrase